jgi:hypothetical protein
MTNAFTRLRLGLIAVTLILSVTGISPANSQDLTIEMHWVGLFGAYSPHPLQNDPLPDITLFPFGELPRPLARTDQVPGKLSTRFGLLFTLHGLKEGLVQVTQIVHYPAPGLSLGPGKSALRQHEDRMLCMVEKPCYVGYSFQQSREILPGEWRMELLLNGAKLHEETFVVSNEPELASNTSLERTRER